MKGSGRRGCRSQVCVWPGTMTGVPRHMLEPYNDNIVKPCNPCIRTYPNPIVQYKPCCPRALIHSNHIEKILNLKLKPPTLSSSDVGPCALSSKPICSLSSGRQLGGPTGEHLCGLASRFWFRVQGSGSRGLGFRASGLRGLGVSAD